MKNRFLIELTEERELERIEEIIGHIQEYRKKITKEKAKWFSL